MDTWNLDCRISHYAWNLRSMKEDKVIKSTQHGITKEESCFTNPTTFYEPSSYEESLEQAGLGEILSMFVYTQRGYKEDGARPYPVVPRDRTRAMGTN
ncbi:hypothetical protein HGM15179_016204 [Zosterops borbonicus]|uniref:Uncharacterized protein n=1 Tax=Zosterops borbonicus TaxID=364589 RepID=A0A8K1G392_9PASS|nr:hypothetical protein HGM15179_016204 [Zosterops borbonicus]